jgi:hypothetical protein
MRSTLRVSKLKLIATSIFGLLTLFVAPLVFAQLDAATLQTVMKKTGTQDQCPFLARDLAGGYKEMLGQPGSNPSAVDSGAIKSAFERAYAPQRFCEIITNQFKSDFDPANVKNLLAFFDTPTGATIVAAELVSFDESSSLAEKQEQGQTWLSQASPARRTLLESLVAVSKLNELTASVLIASEVAIHAGITSVSLGIPGPSNDEVKQQLESQRSQMIEQAGPANIADSARTYAKVSDEALTQYVEFMQTPAAQQFQAVLTKGFVMAVTESGFNLGKSLPTLGSAKTA